MDISQFKPVATKKVFSREPMCQVFLDDGSMCENDAQQSCTYSSKTERVPHVWVWACKEHFKQLTSPK